MRWCPDTQLSVEALTSTSSATVNSRRPGACRRTGRPRPGTPAAQSASALTYSSMSSSAPSRWPPIRTRRGRRRSNRDAHPPTGVAACRVSAACTHRDRRVRVRVRARSRRAGGRPAGTEIPLGVGDTGPYPRGSRGSRPWSALVAGPQDLPRLARRSHDARLGSSASESPSASGSASSARSRGPLETERILDALLRFVGTDDPRPGPLIVLVLARLARPRTAAHLRDAAASASAGDASSCCHQTSPPHHPWCGGERAAPVRDGRNAAVGRATGSSGLGRCTRPVERLAEPWRTSARAAIRLLRVLRQKIARTRVSNRMLGASRAAAPLPAVAQRGSRAARSAGTSPGASPHDPVSTAAASASRNRSRTSRSSIASAMRRAATHQPHRLFDAEQEVVSGTPLRCRRSHRRSAAGRSATPSVPATISLPRLRVAAGETGEPAHRRGRSAAATIDSGASNRAFRNSSMRPRTSARRSTLFGRRRRVAAPAIARDPRRDVRAVDDEIFGFGHSSCDVGSPTAHTDYIVALTRSCMARQQIRVVGQRAEQRRAQAARIGMPLATSRAVATIEPRARHLGQPAIAQLPQPLGQRDERDRRGAVHAALRATRSPLPSSAGGKPNSSATNRCRVLGFRSLSPC